MSEQQLKRLVAVVCVTLLAVIVTGALVGSTSAADDLQLKAERALAGAGLDSVHVDFEGREARLSGGTTEDLGRAELIVEGVDGVRRADIVATAGGHPPAGHTDTSPTLDLRHTDGGIAISGTVPDADATAGIKARAAEAFGVPVTGDLVIDPAVGRASWVTKLPDVFSDVVAVRGLRMTIDGSGTLDLSGSIESDAGADRIRRLVAAVVPDLDVISHLDVEPGDLSEADAAVLNSATLHFDRESSTLDAGSKRELAVVADVLERNARVSIEVGGRVGPADPVEGARLGRARVAAVEAYLVRAGIDAGRISTHIRAADPKSTAGTSARQYRRVDFVVKGE